MASRPKQSNSKWIPASAGMTRRWIPAFAGMTIRGGFRRNDEGAEHHPHPTLALKGRAKAVRRAIIPKQTKQNPAMSDSVLVTRTGSIAEIKLHRPTVHNAFDDKLIADLTAALVDCELDANVRCVVLTGAG